MLMYELYTILVLTALIVVFNDEVMDCISEKFYELTHKKPTE